MGFQETLAASASAAAVGAGASAAAWAARAAARAAAAGATAAVAWAAVCFAVGVTMVGVATCVGHAPEAPTKVVDAGPVTVVDAGLPEQGQSLTLVNQPHAPSRTYASGRGKNGGAPGDLIFLRGDHEAFRIAGDGGFSVEGVPYGRAREGLQAALLAWSTDAVMMQKDGGK